MSTPPPLPLAPSEEELPAILESLLLVAGGPATITSLVAATGASRAGVESALVTLSASPPRGIAVQIHDGAAQLVTAPAHIEYVHRFVGTAKPPPLSRAAAETLTVVAYRQPVTRAEIEAHRGVNSDRALQTLIARGLVEERGPRETLGRPMQFGTGFAFLEYFGLRSLADLPPLPEEVSVNLPAGSIGLRSAADVPPNE